MHQLEDGWCNVVYSDTVRGESIGDGYENGALPSNDSDSIRSFPLERRNLQLFSRKIPLDEVRREFFLLL